MSRSLPALLVTLGALGALGTAAPAARAQGAVLPAPAAVAAVEYADRRAALAMRLGDGILLALGNGEPVNDYESFGQNPSFHYLTGVREAGAALVMVRRGGTTTATLFVQPRNPAAETWTGARMGTAGATGATGLPAREYRFLRPVLDSLLRNVPGDSAGRLPVLRVVGELSGRGTSRSPHLQFVDSIRQAHANLQVQSGEQVLSQLRGRKSAAELELVRRAVAITVQAQGEAMRAIEPGMNEFEIQALIEYTFRRNGADRPSFSTIVGSGPNSTTLHYNADDRFMGAGEVVVMDIGASYRGYAADVTRTVPVSGTFSPAQREIYQIVRDAQAAAEREAKPGAPAQRMVEASNAVLAAGLVRLGLIESADAMYDCATERQCPQLSLFYMHGLGHGIGLEVHDPDQYYFTGTIAQGSAFTLEPGIYVRGNVLDILPDTPRNRALKEKIRPAATKYANIGVRIEDDYIVTAQGVEWISRAPREIAEIEAMMRQPFAGPAPRDPRTVEWYRATSGGSR